MNWLAQNWIWIAAAIALVFFLQRRGWGKHAHHGAGIGGQDHEHGNAQGQAGAAPGAAIDPVSGSPVRTDRALSAVHGEHVFYFESAETRARFEAEPDKYAANATATSAPERQHRHHHHGC